jgi:hypothetical protein
VRFENRPKTANASLLVDAVDAVDVVDIMDDVDNLLAFCCSGGKELNKAKQKLI